MDTKSTQENSKKTVTFIAILNTTNFDGFYTTRFECPKEYSEFNPKSHSYQDTNWYYLNYIDFSGCLVMCIPAELVTDVPIYPKTK